MPHDADEVFAEDTGRIDDSITLESVGKRSYGRESKANIRGNARRSELLGDAQQ